METKTGTKETTIVRPQRIIQNFLLVWLDNHINKSDDEFQNSLSQLRTIVNSIFTFINSNQYIVFLKTIKDENVFMIICGDMNDHIVPRIHNIDQLDSIYIFDSNKRRYEQRSSDWIKVKGTFTEITSICDSLKQAADRTRRTVRRRLPGSTFPVNYK